MTLQCSYYCTGESYNLSAISDYLSKADYTHRIYSTDTIHIEGKEFSRGDILIFSYGVLIFWGVEPTEELKFIQEMSVFLKEPLELAIVDKCDYEISEENKSYIDMENDVIKIGKEDYDDQFVKLAFSYGLAQSVKLNLFENSVAKTINENKHIPNELIKNGKISMSKSKLAKKVGRLFQERSLINLNNYILDMPHFFWRKPMYEEFYEASRKFMDIKQRVDNLNSRLSVIHDLYEILSNEVKHSDSSRLELVIIFLIFIEVILIIIKDVFHLI